MPAVAEGAIGKQVVPEEGLRSCIPSIPGPILSSFQQFLDIQWFSNHLQIA